MARRLSLAALAIAVAIAASLALCQGAGVGAGRHAWASAAYFLRRAPFRFPVMKRSSDFRRNLRRHLHVGGSAHAMRLFADLLTHY